MYLQREYRKDFGYNKLISYEVKLESTDLFIASEKNSKDEVKDKVRILREDILTYSKRDARFLDSLEPIEAYADAPYIVKRMSDAALKAGVGPMAAVAGGVAQIIGDMLTADDKEAVVENGGDVFVCLKHDLTFKVFAGSESLFSGLRLIIKKEFMPLGICTSSGRIGPSLSFGDADAACVISRDVFLADACATRAANMVCGRPDIEKAINYTKSVEGVLGAVIIRDDKIGLWGNIAVV